MRRRNAPLWIVFAVTLGLCLRGILPAQAQAGVTPVLGAHSIAIGQPAGMQSISTHPSVIHAACHAGPVSSRHEHPEGMPAHNGHCTDHSHGSECPLCPPAIACAIGYILPDLAFFSASSVSTSARYEWRVHTVQSGLDLIPDDRPPRPLLTV